MYSDKVKKLTAAKELEHIPNCNQIQSINYVVQKSKLVMEHGIIMVPNPRPMSPQ
jgi:hypothetical protein